MPTTWFLSLRFLKEGRMQSWLIVGGVAVGVGVIVFLSALITGLQSSLIKQTLGSQAHVVIRPPEEVPRTVLEAKGGTVAARVEQAAQKLRSIEQWQQVDAAVHRLPGVLATSPTVSGAAFAVRGDADRSIVLRGVLPDRMDQVIHLKKKIVAGRYRIGGDLAVVGVELAKALGLGVGDKIRVVTAGGRSDVFTIAGLFDVGTKEINERWVLVPLHTAQSLLDLVGGVSTIEVRVKDIFAADQTAALIRSRTGLEAESWMQINAQLMIALRSQGSSSAMIQVFVIVAVALGIASVLVVSVVQKSREIGILKAFGTSTGQVQRVFLLQGALVGLAGSVLGIALGAGLATFFASMAKGPGGAPLFPVNLTAALFLRSALIATGVGLLAAVAPARRAAKLDPAEVIRYG